MKKCLIIWLLVLSMITVMLPVGAASDKVVFDIRVPSEFPKAGETFEVAIELSNNPGFCAIQFALSYDSAAMKCDDVITDGILSGILSATNPKAKDGAIVAAVSLKALKGDGTIALYAFTANEDITDFGFKLKNIVLADENNVDIEYEVADGLEAEDEPSVPKDTTEVEEEIIDEPSDAVEEDNSQENEASGSLTDREDVGADETEVTDPSESPELSGAEKEETVTEHIFPDVTGHWAETFVNEAVKHGLFKGDENGNFNPDDNVTRAQFVTVLWRMAGAPNVSTELPFTDIETQIPEFQSAIAWGYANGYINGTSETTFDPDGTLTREAGMKILHYYSGGKVGMEIQLYGVYDGMFKDSSQVSEWAKKSVYWGIYNKMISGTSETTLNPQGTATRAQLAKILVNYLNIK